MAGSKPKYELRFYYTVGGLEHIMRHGVSLLFDPAIGSEFDTIVALDALSDESYLDVVVDGVVALMQPLYGASDDIERAELWTNHTGDSGGTYISAYDISLAGTGGGGQSASQVIFTFRTQIGKVAKLYLMECNISTNNVLRPPYPAGALKNFSDHFIGVGSFLLGRGEFYAKFPLGVLMGQNEAIWRKRYRP